MTKNARPPAPVIRVATFGQLVAAGSSPAQLRRLVRQGQLCMIRRGVYASIGLAADATNKAHRHALLIAAEIAAGDSRAAGSHESAAVIHGLDLSGKGPDDVVTLTRSPGGRGSRSRRGDSRVHTAELPPDHLVTKGGVLITSVARTVVDLARGSSFRDGIITADSALRTRKTDIAKINAVIADCARWPGLQRARDVAAFSDGGSESALESIGRVAFHQAGLPPPRLQVWVGGEFGTIGRADFFWPEHRTIAEADGAVKYADPGRAIEQLDRDARLRDAGFEVVHFTWQEITVTPWQVIGRIRAAFARGTAR